jgi:hypothetical protein
VSKLFVCSEPVYLAVINLNKRIFKEMKVQSENLRSSNSSPLTTTPPVVLGKAAFTDTSNTLVRRTAYVVLSGTVSSVLGSSGLLPEVL